MLFKIALTLFVVNMSMLVVGILGGITDKTSSTYNAKYCRIGGIMLFMTILFTAAGCIGLIWF